MIKRAAKYVSIWFILVLLVIFIAGAHAKQYEAKVVNIVDGDTIDAVVSLGFNVFVTERFRMADYDAPETFRPTSKDELETGRKATIALSKMILNQDVIIDTEKRGKYGRWIATVYKKGVSINREMMIKGHTKVKP